MVNLEWYRTFKAVYKNNSLSKAAKELFISQPAVSQQLAMLEAHVGQKLFQRKSKGVVPTENGKLLNNMIIDALDRLEEVETTFKKNTSASEGMFSLGLSAHFYKGVVADQLSLLGDYVDIRFQGSNGTLFEMVNNGELHFAIVRGRFDTFDTVYKSLFTTRVGLVSHAGIDSTVFHEALSEGDFSKAETWLNEQVWFTHHPINPYIKYFWLHAFQKQRPKVVVNYVIPNEHFMLEHLISMPGIAASNFFLASHFIRGGGLKPLWFPESVPEEEYFLIMHKRNPFKARFEALHEALVIPGTGLA